jgi:hypothetical protein
MTLETALGAIARLLNDHCGERLIGCVRCNRWCWQPDKSLLMELPEEDIRQFEKRQGGSIRPKPTPRSPISQSALSAIPPPTLHPTAVMRTGLSPPAILGRAGVVSIQIQ